MQYKDEYSLLPSLVKQVADASFNRITVDGDTSTNDAFVIAFTGNSDLPVIENAAQYEYSIVRDALVEVARTCSSHCQRWRGSH